VIEVGDLPEEHASEAYIVGAMLAFPRCIPEARRLVHPHDFIDGQLAAVFNAISRQHLEGDIAPELIARDLRDDPAFDTDHSTSPAALIYELMQKENAPTATRVPSECALIVDASRKRQLYAIAEQARNAALNGETAADVLAGIDADLWEFRRNTTGEPKYVGIDAQQLATGDYRLEYLIDGLLVQGQPGFLGGPKKSLKTSLALDLGLSLVTGGCFLGKFRVNARRRVVILSGESGLATLQETALRVCLAMGIELADVDGFTICTTLPRLNNESDLTECQQFLIDAGAEVAIFDPLYLMLSGDDAGNLFKQGALLRNVSEACTSVNVTPLLCHHTKSTGIDPFAPAELDHLAWSGCAEFARQWLLVSRREQYEPGSGIHRLWLTAGGSAGHSGLWGVDVDEGHQTDPGGRRWEVAVDKADAARDAAAERKAQAKESDYQRLFADDRTKVCRLLAKHADGKSKTFIRDHCGVSSRRWPSVFAAMFEAGDLVECEIIVSNKKTPQPGYRLNVTESF
jgi:hypothetical protein